MEALHCTLPRIVWKFWCGRSFHQNTWIRVWYMEQTNLFSLSLSCSTHWFDLSVWLLLHPLHLRPAQRLIETAMTKTLMYQQILTTTDAYYNTWNTEMIQKSKACALWTWLNGLRKSISSTSKSSSMSWCYRCTFIHLYVIYEMISWVNFYSFHMFTISFLI